MSFKEKMPRWKIEWKAHQPRFCTLNAIAGSVYVRALDPDSAVRKAAKLQKLDLRTTEIKLDFLGE